MSRHFILPVLATVAVTFMSWHLIRTNRMEPMVPPPVQPAELDLSAFAGHVPVEMLGYTEFPVIGTAPYFLTLGPYGFYWFELQRPGR